MFQFIFAARRRTASASETVIKPSPSTFPFVSFEIYCAHKKQRDAYYGTALLYLLFTFDRIDFAATVISAPFDGDVFA